MTTALLVIDLQRGMFEGEQPPLDGAAMLARVAALLERARQRGVPVLHVRHDGGTGDILERGTPGWEIHPTSRHGALSPSSTSATPAASTTPTWTSGYRRWA